MVQTESTAATETEAPEPARPERIDVRAFAKKYRLHVNDRRLARKYRLEWTEDVIPGRYGEIADFVDFGEAEFRLRLFAVPRNATNKALLNRRRKALAGGLRLKHKADAESIFYFDPTNQHEAELAIRLVGARRKRRVTVTPAVLENLRRARECHSLAGNPSEEVRTETLASK